MREVVCSGLCLRGSCTVLFKVLLYESTFLIFLGVQKSLENLVELDFLVKKGTSTLSKMATPICIHFGE